MTSSSARQLKANLVSASHSELAHLSNPQSIGPSEGLRLLHIASLRPDAKHGHLTLHRDGCVEDRRGTSIATFFHIPPASYAPRVDLADFPQGPGHEASEQQARGG